MAEQRPDRPARRTPKPGGDGNKGGGNNGTGGGNGSPGNNGGGMRVRGGILGWMVVVGLALALVYIVQANKRTQTTIAESEWFHHIAKVQSMEIDADEVTGTFSPAQNVTNVDGVLGNVTTFRVQLQPGQANEGWLHDYLRTNAPSASFRNVNNQNFFLQLLVPLIPWVVVFAILYFVVFRQLRNGAGAGGMLGNFGRSKHKITSKEHTNVTFDDVAGVEEAKEEVMEIVEFLKNPKKFQRLGGRIPRGVLLVGEPGTGKTLLAKAIAGEADAPFFSISGSDFVEMFVGVGASRVRDLFKQAKDNSPCIIFLDEIDAVGRRRGSGLQLRRWTRRAGADAERDPGRDGRVRHQRPGDRRRQHEPGRRARPCPDPPRAVRPSGVRPAAGREGATGNPQGPQPQGEAGAEHRPAAAGPGDAGVQRGRPGGGHQ